MRLTNAMRDKFVNDVMARVPKKVTCTQESIKAEIEKRLKALWPKDLAEFVKKFPEQVLMTSVAVRWLEYSDNETSQHYSGRVSCLKGYGDINAVYLDDLKSNWTDWHAEHQSRKEIRSKISQQVYGVTTTQQLAALLPDLAGLVPKEPAKGERMLPVAAKGLIDELKAKGLEVPV